MRYLWCFGILLAAVAPAAAQDMNLTNVLLPGEEWHELADKEWQAVPLEAMWAAALVGDGRGNVYFVNGQQIWRVDKDEKASVFARTESVVQGLAVGPDGKIFAAEPDRKRVLILSANGQEVGKTEGEAIHDLVVSKQGAIYATLAYDPGVFLFQDGKKRKVADVMVMPAGLALWADGGTLVVGDPCDKYLYALRVRKEGTLDAKDRYYPLWTQPRAPSECAGLTLDAAGRIYATSREGIQVFDPTGRLSGIVTAPEKNDRMDGVAYGGAELDRLYVTCGGKVYVRKLLAKGAPAEARKRP